MVDVTQQYQALAFEQDLARALAGGGLSQEEESAFVDRFEVLWNQMTRKEQEEVERLLVRVPEAPEELGLTDRVVTHREFSRG